MEGGLDRHKWHSAIAGGWDKTAVNLKYLGSSVRRNGNTGWNRVRIVCAGLCNEQDSCRYKKSMG